MLRVFCTDVWILPVTSGIDARGTPYAQTPPTRYGDNGISPGQTATSLFMTEENIFPEPPSFSEEDMRRCRETGDYKPVLFEWYKFAGSLCFLVVHLQPDSPAFHAIPAQYYHVLIGLLNRCARLMLSNVALSYQGKFGETTAIVDRCIFESAIKIIWLCHDVSQEEFTRYLADGLKTELTFKAYIEGNITSRGGETLPIENRMLTSINNHITASGLTESEIKSSRKLRDLAAMIDDLGFDRLLYIAGQKIGSHHVHGTWSSLLFHYLEERENDGDALSFRPRADHCDTHINQYMFVPLIVLRAMADYVRYTLDEDEAKVLCSLFKSTEEEIMKIYNEAGEDAQ